MPSTRLTEIKSAIRRKSVRTHSDRSPGAESPAPQLPEKADQDSACKFARDLLSDAREDLARADNKASILLAATGVVVGALVAGLMSSGWSPVKLAQPWAEVWVLGAATALVGIGCLVLAVYPRSAKGQEEESAIYYFDHIRRSDTAADIRLRIEKAALDPLARLSHQVTHVSRIATVKYSWVRWGIRCLSLAAVLVLGAVVLDEVAHLR